MKQEIEKSLKDEIAYIVADNLEWTTEYKDGDELAVCHPKPIPMIAQLQKLFLSKQIELLNEIGANGAIIYEADILKKKLSLFSELKALQ